MVDQDTGGNAGPSYGPQIFLDPQLTACNPTNYIAQDAVVTITIWNSFVGQTVAMNITQIDATGHVVSATFTAVPATNRAQQNFTFPMTEGFLQRVMVNGINGTSPGQTFVRLVLTKQNFVNGMVLCQGYVGGQQDLSWPNGSLRQITDGKGFMRSISGTLPAAGAEISEVVPAHCLWRLILFNYGLTTSAAVASRGPGFIIDDGTNNLLVYPSVNAVTAAGAGSFNAIAGSNLSYGASFPVNWPVPPQMWLGAGFRIRTLTTNIQAADQYTAPQYLVEEFIGP